LICAAAVFASAAFAQVPIPNSVPPPPGQDPNTGKQGSSIKVDVDLVVLHTTVIDDRQRFADGLKPENFRVFEDKVEQKLSVFKREDVPVSMGLVIDNSGSMRDKHADVTLAALEFAGASNPQDEMFVVNFNEKVYFGLPSSIRFTNDVDQVRSALFPRPPEGLTALYDALAVGLEHLKTGTRDRKALVVLSDGGDNASRRRLDDVLQIAQQSSATIYTIGIYDDSDLDKNPRVLRKIAEASGGRAYFPGSLKDLGQVWRDIAGGIRSQYTIGYRSSDSNRDGTFRKVKITAGRNGGNGLRVTTRPGYVAAK